MQSALEAAVMQPAFIAMETELRLQLFAVAEAADEGPSSGNAAVAARAAAAEAVAEAHWVAAVAALPPLRLVTTVVSIRCTPPWLMWMVSRNVLIRQGGVFTAIYAIDSIMRNVLSVSQV